jgi:hypothetical protein
MPTTNENAIIEQGKQAIKSKGKPRGGNSPMIGDNGVNTKPGDNTRYAGILTQLHKWGEVDHANIKALEQRFWQFVDFCGANDVRVTNQLAYFALGLNKDNVYDWENGRGRTSAHSDFIKKVKSFCGTYREMLGADGRLNPVTLVWWQKNYDGFVDKSEVVLTPNNPLGSDSDPATMAQKYQKALPGASIEAEGE